MRCDFWSIGAGFRLGFLDRERREFWRFFRQAVIEHRDRFAASMRLAAMGYHFRKLVEAYGEWGSTADEGPQVG